MLIKNKSNILKYGSEFRHILGIYCIQSKIWKNIEIPEIYKKKNVQIKKNEN